MSANLVVLLIIFFATLILLVTTLVALESRDRLKNLKELDEQIDEKLANIVDDESEPDQSEDEQEESEPKKLDESGSAKDETSDEPLEIEYVMKPEEAEEPDEDPLELPFEPINTFKPDPDQWTDRYRELNRYPWPTADSAAQSEYEDRSDPDPASKSFEEAVDWLTGAGTEAIHRQNKFVDFFSSLTPFIEDPRSAGAEAVARVPWRAKSANISRLIGERFLVMALALSCYGAVKMNSHSKALKNLLSGQWNADGLETPLVYQAMGRLGLLTATETGTLQEMLKSHLSACLPDREGPVLKRPALARYHALLLALSAGPEYPFPVNEQQRSRLWVPEGERAPLAIWEYLLPVLYALWNYHWHSQAEYDPVRDLTGLLGEWWDEFPPRAGFFDDHPEIWEAILMCSWAWTPEHPRVWELIEERFAALEYENLWLDEVTEGYRGWVEQYRESSSQPSESFTHRRLPPISWIKPLPSDLLGVASQPSFDFPDSWLSELARIDWPDVYNLQKSYRPGAESN